MKMTADSEFMDRREAPRLEIGLPVELERGNGWTRDISASGVFFETDESFTPGAPIRFSLLLEHVYPSPFRLECQGQIVRVERREGKVGVAAAINSYRLIPEARHPGVWQEWTEDDRPRRGLFEVSVVDSY